MSGKSFEEILAGVRAFAATTPDLEAPQRFIVEIISKGVPWYNWAGFYMLDPDDAAMLVLGPFRGAPTPHVRIPVSQ